MAYNHYFYGQTTDPMTSMVNAIESGLTAAGWSLVDSGFTIAGPNASRSPRVWKSPGTANSTGADFFLILLPLTTYAAATAPQLMLTMCETWDVPTHTGGRPIQVAGTSGLGSFGPDGVGGGTKYALSTATTGGWSYNTSTSFNLNMTPTDLDVYVIANADILAVTYRMATSANASTGGSFMYGCWDAGHTTTPTAIVNASTGKGYYVGRIMHIDSNSYANNTPGATTRTPLYLSSGTTYNNAFYPTIAQPCRGQLGYGLSLVDPMTNDIAGSPIVMTQAVMYLSQSNGSTITTPTASNPGKVASAVVGKLPSGIVTFAEMGGSYIPTNGDMVTIGGTTYTRMGYWNIINQWTNTQYPPMAFYVSQTL